MGGDQSETFYQDFLQHMRSTYRVDAVKGRNFQKSFPYRYSRTFANGHHSSSATFIRPGRQKIHTLTVVLTSPQRPLSFVAKVAFVERFNCNHLKYFVGILP